MTTMCVHGELTRTSERAIDGTSFLQIHNSMTTDRAQYVESSSGLITVVVMTLLSVQVVRSCPFSSSQTKVREA